MARSPPRSPLRGDGRGWDRVPTPDAANIKPPHGIAAAAVAAAVFSSFLFGYSICVLDSCSELLAVALQWCGNDWQSNCPESEAHQGLINAALYLGAIFGAVLSGRPWVFMLGGRKQLVISDVFFCIGGLISFTARGFVSVMTGRVFCGFGMGLCAVAAPLYMAEVSPREMRGRYTTMHQVFISLGILASIALGLPQNPPPSDSGDQLSPLDSWYWRFLLALPAVPAAIQAVLLLWVCPVDPPAFLVLRGKVPDAYRLLRRIYGLGKGDDSGAGPGLEALQEPLKPDVTERHCKELLQELEDATALAAASPQVSIWPDLIVHGWRDPFLRRPLLIGLGLAAFQQLCGINALMSYSNMLFSQADIAPSNLTMASTSMAIANVVVSICSAQVADGWGRRTLMLGGAGLQAVSMLALSFALSHGQAIPPVVVIVMFTIFVTSFSAGIGAVTWLYIAECYPMEVRGSALCICGVANWVSSFVVVYGTRFLSLVQVCTAFGIICSLGSMCIYIWVIETRGCSLDDSPMTPISQRSTSIILSPASSHTNLAALAPADSDDDDIQHI